MIGIIGAMNVEINGYLSLLEKHVEQSFGCFHFHTGLLCNKEVVIAKCGVGKVCAAACTTAMILKYSPDLIINTGVAGGLLSAQGMKTGDIVIASDVVHHDANVCNLGYEDGQIPDMPTFYPCDKDALNELIKIARNVLDVNIFSGRIASGDRFVCSSSDAQNIYERFSPAAVEMESSAIGQACYMLGTSFVIIRSISDCADEEATQSYEEFTQIAAKNAITLACEFLKRRS